MMTDFRSTPLPRRIGAVLALAAGLALSGCFGEDNPILGEWKLDVDATLAANDSRNIFSQLALHSDPSTKLPLIIRERSFQYGPEETPVREYVVEDNLVKAFVSEEHAIEFTHSEPYLTMRLFSDVPALVYRRKSE